MSKRVVDAEVRERISTKRGRKKGKAPIDPSEAASFEATVIDALRDLRKRHRRIPTKTETANAVYAQYRSPIKKLNDELRKYGINWEVLTEKL